MNDAELDKQFCREAESVAFRDSMTGSGLTVARKSELRKSWPASPMEG